MNYEIKISTNTIHGELKKTIPDELLDFIYKVNSNNNNNKKKSKNGNKNEK